MALPDWMNPNKRTIRGPINPLDKSTIVSVYPREIHEKKETMFPGTFHIPAGSLDKPAILTVGPSSWWKELDEEQPLLEIPVSSIQVADSVVRDYCNGLIECDMGERMPGLFFIPGHYSVEQIRKEKANLLKEADRKQRNWYQRLLKLADALWARTNGNPLVIPEDAKLAATELGVEKAWLKDTQFSEMVKCRACQTVISSAVVVCPNCKVIVDMARFKELGLQFANQ